MITHYDLFAGIGGFSIALEEVFSEQPIRHIFCEWESFPTAVLKQHWPDGEFFGDIADLVTHTDKLRSLGGQFEIDTADGQHTTQPESTFSVVTGGFPCQPFSHAGRRRGTEDNRYQWPNMFEVIRNVKPTWVIAENVRGLVTWNDGMVLEQVCTDLESEGYEVQPIIIPAVAVNAPHRRDRVWIIAHANIGQSDSGNVTKSTKSEQSERSSENRATTHSASQRNDGGGGEKRRANQRIMESQEQKGRQVRGEGKRRIRNDWNRDWREVAFATCHAGVDDGLSREVDGVPYTYAKWREASIKAYGNAIVPQVAVEIFKAIKNATNPKEITNETTNNPKVPACERTNQSMYST